MIFCHESMINEKIVLIVVTICKCLLYTYTAAYREVKGFYLLLLLNKGADDTLLPSLLHIKVSDKSPTSVLHPLYTFLAAH